MNFFTSNELVEKTFTLTISSHKIVFDVLATPANLSLFENFLKLAQVDFSKEAYSFCYLFNILDKEEEGKKHDN